MLVDESFNDFFLGIIEICSRRICRDDIIDDLDALSIVFALFYPANTGRNIFESFSFKLFFGENFLDHLKYKQTVLFIEASVFLYLFEE